MLNCSGVHSRSYVCLEHRRERRSEHFAKYSGLGRYEPILIRSLRVSVALEAEVYCCADCSNDKYDENASVIE